MASKTPVIRQISWLMVIPQLLVMAALIVFVAVLFRPEPLIMAVTYGSFLYLLYSYGSRWLLLKSHRQGMDLTQDKDYQGAIEKYSESYKFFSDYPWIDRYRYLTMMSPSLISFREMALINIAFCYSQMGDYANTKHFYQKALAEFPDSEMAKVALTFIATAETGVENQK
ncbi:MAG: tetratricopeptide repeat protein [Anaerolineae bacterium]|nr:tetratricopeptide repeat protein [Anaerolineae bacterium]